MVSLCMYFYHSLAKFFREIALRKTIMVVFLALLISASVATLSSCSGNSSEEGRGAVYVKPSVDYRGRYRRGHVRMPVSTKKDALKRQNRSRYYYHTRGKYRRKNKSK
jgi:hypothetical protein